ncbi:MAG: T9SS type A sorting domain-containing protein, partial [Bacteroidota bacterium]
SGSIYSLQIAKTSGSVSLGSNLGIMGDLIVSAGAINTGGNTLSVAGNVVLNDSVTSSTGGSLNLHNAGSASLNISGTAAKVRNLTMNNTGGATVATDLHVTGTLVFTQGVLTVDPANTLYLAPSAQITGEGTGAYAAGKLSTAALVGTGAATFGGLGFSIAAGADNLGTVTLVRNSGASAISTFNGNAGSISRLFSAEITGDQPTNGRVISLTWTQDEDNSSDSAHMNLWTRHTATDPWTKLTFVPSAAYPSEAQASSRNRSMSATTTHFSDFTASDLDNPLPVTLLYFTADRQADGSALLKWATASERNNKEFRVQRSDDGFRFKDATVVPGSVNSFRPLAYSFTDVAAMSLSTVYYRLKQTDVDGKSNYSKTVSLSESRVTEEPRIFPNPFRDNIAVTVFGSQKISYTELFDYTGKLVHTEAPATTGKDLVIGGPAISNLPAGVYLLRVTTNAGVKLVKVVKD